MALLFAVDGGMLDDLPLDRVEAFRAALRTWLGEHCPDVLALDDQASELRQDVRAQLANLKDLARTIAGMRATPPVADNQA